MGIYELEGLGPERAERCWVAETATVIGRVRLKMDASVWFGSVLRALDPNATQLIAQAADTYVKRWQRYAKELRRIG